MSLETVTVTWTEQDIGQAPLGGNITFTLSEPVSDSTGGTDTQPVPKTYFFTSGTGTSDPLVANDSDVQPAGSYYTISVAITGQASYSFKSQILFANGASQTLAFLQANAAVPAAQFSAYLPLPSGTPAEGDVPTVIADDSTATVWAPSGSGGSGYPATPVVSGTPSAGQVLTATSPTAADWQTPSGGGAVSSVFTRTGAVVAATGDYSVGQVTGAAPFASPAFTGTPTAPTATALTNSTRVATTAYTDAAVGVETTRAEAAEALLAPKASPALTGTPTAPTAAALTDDTQIATTAYTDAAVAVETTRAEAAEALKAPMASPVLTGSPAAPTQTPGDNTTKIATDAFVTAAVAVETGRAETAEGLAAQKASNLSDLASASTARTNLGLGTAATQATSAFDAAGAAAAAAAASLPLTGGTMSGAIAMGSHKVTGLTNGSAASDAAAFGQIPAALPPNGTAGGVLSGSYPNPGFATPPLPESGGTMTGWLAPAVASLTFGSTIAVNAALGNAFALTLTASTGTLSNPTNPVDGQTIRVRVIQDGTGSRTLAFGTAYDFGAAGAPTLSTAASKVDILGFEYVASLSKWCYLGSGLGF